MTSDDIKRHIGEVIVSHQEAKKAVTILRHRCSGIALHLIQAANMLRSNPSRMFEPRPPTTLQPNGAGPILDDPTFAEVVDAQKIRALVEELREAEARERELAQQKRELGIE